MGLQGIGAGVRAARKEAHFAVRRSAPFYPGLTVNFTPISPPFHPLGIIEPIC
jgi:hypothetical protein